MIEGRDFAVAATVGGRESQQDDWGLHAEPPAQEPRAGLLAAVADGMGGAPAGDRASEIAIRAFLDAYSAIELPAWERLREAMLRANEALERAVAAEPALAGMGTTLVAALFFPNRCEWLSVGDSLLLLCRQGHVERINPLHIYARELDEQVRQGTLTEEEALADPERHALTSVLMGFAVEEVAQGELALQPGDVLLLASDGLAALAAAEVADACTASGPSRAERIAGALIERIDVRQREGQDNATVIAVCPPPADADTACVDPVRGSAPCQRRKP